MEGRFKNISIKGIQVTAPNKHINNNSFSDLLGAKRCKRQIRLTGVERRYLCPDDQTEADLVYEAGRTLLENIRWNPKDIDVLIFATQSPLFKLPATSFLLQKWLNISSECVVFDINLGCSGAVVGIQVVASLLQNMGCGGKGLLLVGDPAYEPTEVHKNPDNLANQMIFGAAGGAVAIQLEENPDGEIPFLTYSDGERYKSIFCDFNNFIEMDGESVFDFGVSDVVKGVIDFKTKYGIADSEIDYYSFHQAQKLMLDTIDSECGIPIEKDLRSLTEYGNTSGASVLVNLCSNRDRFTDKQKYNLLLCGFGVGLSWSYIYFTINKDAIFPVLYTNECYGG